MAVKSKTFPLPAGISVENLAKHMKDSLSSKGYASRETVSGSDVTMAVAKDPSSLSNEKKCLLITLRPDGSQLYVSYQTPKYGGIIRVFYVIAFIFLIMGTLLRSMIGSILALIFAAPPVIFDMVKKSQANGMLSDIEQLINSSVSERSPIGGSSADGKTQVASGYQAKPNGSAGAAFCPSCGANTLGGKFCPKCGARVE